MSYCYVIYHSTHLQSIKLLVMFYISVFLGNIKSQIKQVIKVFFLFFFMAPFTDAKSQKALHKGTMIFLIY